MKIKKIEDVVSKLIVPENQSKSVKKNLKKRELKYDEKDN